jgi:rSAM/selenodomain-associated transferase 2
VKLSVIVPIFNNERTLVAALKALRIGAPQAEIVIVDGGGTDSGVELARTRCDRIVKGPAGRARQMNAGAAVSAGDVLAFVHSDTIVPSTFGSDIEVALADPQVLGGSFDLELDHRSPLMRMVAAAINLRSRLTRVAGGGHAIFMRRSVFEQLGGFAEIDFCEDLDMSRRLKRLGRVASLASRVITPARRWRQEGIPETAVRLSLIRLLFMLGVNPTILRRIHSHRT